MNIETLNLLIKDGEGIRVKFKEKYSSKIARDIVAFSHTKGGYILLGVTEKLIERKYPFFFQQNPLNPPYQRVSYVCLRTKSAPS